MCIEDDQNQARTSSRLLITIFLFFETSDTFFQDWNCTVLIGYSIQFV